MAKINFNTIDISQDANAEEYKFMLEHATQMGATSMCPNPKVPLPPQIFNEDVYCGVIKYLLCLLGFVVIYFQKLYLCEVSQNQLIIIF